MTLYRMELYRILHRKILLILGGFMLVWVLVYFGIESVGGERSTVEGKTYDGYAAVVEDRRITADFSGDLTDAEVQAIADKYGFPSKVEKDYGGWRDKNYLNGFVADNLSDGYLYDWNDFKVAQGTIPISDSRLIEYLQTPGERLEFGYSKGWMKFLDLFQMTTWFFSVWIIAALAPLFCEERQLRVRQIIFTAEKGKGPDIRVRLAAAFTVSVSVYVFFVLLLLGLCQAVFGLEGGNMKAGILLNTNSYYACSHYTIKAFTGLYLLTAFCGILMLTAVIVWISARAETVVQSLLACVLSWVIPLGLLLTFQSRFFYFFAAIQPAMLTNYICLVETESMYWLRVAVVCIVIPAGIIYGGKTWKKADLV